jgi:hypothetical protein
VRVSLGGRQKSPPVNPQVFRLAERFTRRGIRNRLEEVGAFEGRSVRRERATAWVLILAVAAAFVRQDVPQVSLAFVRAGQPLENVFPARHARRRKISVPDLFIRFDCGKQK